MTVIKAPERRRWTDTETGQKRVEAPTAWILRGRTEMFKAEQNPIEPQFLFGYDIAHELDMELAYGVNLRALAAMFGMTLVFDPGRDGWEIRFLTQTEWAEREVKRGILDRREAERRIYEAGGLG